MNTTSEPAWAGACRIHKSMQAASLMAVQDRPGSSDQVTTLNPLDFGLANSSAMFKLIWRRGACKPGSLAFVEVLSTLHYGYASIRKYRQRRRNLPYLWMAYGGFGFDDTVARFSVGEQQFLWVGYGHTRSPVNGAAMLLGVGHQVPESLPTFGVVRPAYLP